MKMYLVKFADDTCAEIYAFSKESAKKIAEEKWSNAVVKSVALRIF